MKILYLLNGIVYGASTVVLFNPSVSAVLTGAIVGAVIAIVKYHAEDRGVNFNQKDTFWSV